jgi:hypothetical protein
LYTKGMFSGPTRELISGTWCVS